MDCVRDSVRYRKHPVSWGVTEEHHQMTFLQVRLHAPAKAVRAFRALDNVKDGWAADVDDPSRSNGRPHGQFFGQDEEDVVMVSLTILQVARVGHHQPEGTTRVHVPGNRSLHLREWTQEGRCGRRGVRLRSRRLRVHNIRDWIGRRSLPDPRRRVRGSGLWDPETPNWWGLRGATVRQWSVVDKRGNAFLAEPDLHLQHP